VRCASHSIPESSATPTSIATRCSPPAQRGEVGRRVRRGGCRRYSGVTLLLLCTFPLSSCVRHGAPSFVLFGAFFPAWLLIGAIGILVALATRAAMVETRLSEQLQPQLLVCVSVGVAVAVLLWLLWFAP
jgi:YtcA family